MLLKFLMSFLPPCLYAWCELSPFLEITPVSSWGPDLMLSRPCYGIYFLMESLLNSLTVACLLSESLAHLIFVSILNPSPLYLSAFHLLFPTWMFYFLTSENLPILWVLSHDTLFLVHGCGSSLWAIQVLGALSTLRTAFVSSKFHFSQLGSVSTFCIMNKYLCLFLFKCDAPRSGQEAPMTIW